MVTLGPKEFAAIVVADASSTVVSLLKENAHSPILVTESGIVTEVSLLLENAFHPIPVTELGIVTEVR